MEDNESRLWILLSKKMSGGASTTELTELEGLLTLKGIRSDDEELINVLWNIQLEKAATPDADENWVKLSNRLFPEKSIFHIGTVTGETGILKASPKKWLTIAASVLILFSAGIIFYHKSISKENIASRDTSHLQNQVVSRNGSKTTLTLPDGTKVWLNAGSKIYYENDFSANREVYLTGEAFFDVAHDASKQFVIHAANVMIKVLGTTFNVKAYPDDDRVETALIKGSIELFTDDDPDRKILLRPNEKIAILKTKNSLDSFTSKTSATKPPKKTAVYSITLMQLNRKDSTVEETAWMQGKLIFNGEIFGRLATQMERWYGVSITFQNADLTKIRFTGVFDNQNIVEALDALAYSCNFKFFYSINKNQITIQQK